MNCVRILALAAATALALGQAAAQSYPAKSIKIIVSTSAGGVTDIAARVLAEVCEQAGEFSRHGYDFVLIGDRDGLAEALSEAGLTVPDQVVPSDAAELFDFLNARPAPVVSTWSWLTPGA